MAGVQVASFNWGYVVDGQTGRPKPDQLHTINTTVYQDAELTVELDPALYKSDAEGLLPGFVSDGTYLQTDPDGDITQVEAVTGRVPPPPGVPLGGVGLAHLAQELKPPPYGTALSGDPALRFIGTGGVVADDDARLLAAPADPEAFATEVLADTPSLFWSYDELSGTTADDETANNRDGTHVGAVTPGVEGAIVGSLAADYDGATGKTTSTYGPFGAASARTFMFVAYRDVNTANHAIFGSQGATPVILRINSGGNTISFWARSSGSSVNWTNIWPGDAQWVLGHITYTEAATGTAKLFINGVSQGTKTFTGTSGSYASPGNLVVAARGSAATDAFNGKIGAFAVFEAILIDARMLAQFDALGGAITPPPPAPTLPTAYVATTGSDAAAGTIGAPFATVAHAQTWAATYPGGCEILLRGGSYSTAIAPASAAAMAARTGYMTIAAYDPVGEPVTLTASGGHSLNGSRFTRLRNLNFVPSAGSATLMTYHLLTDFQVVNCHFENFGQAWGAGVRRVLWDGCTFSDPYSPDVATQRGNRLRFGDEPGAGQSAYSEDVTIRRCTFDGTPAVGAGLDTDGNNAPIGGGEPLQFFSSARNILIEDCEFVHFYNMGNPATRWHTNALHFELYPNLNNVMENITVRRNYFHGLSYMLLQPRGDAQGDDPGEPNRRILNVRYENNVIVSKFADRNYSSFGYPTGTPIFRNVDGLWLVNNTIWGGLKHGPIMFGCTGVHLVNNIVPEWRTAGTGEPSSAVVEDRDNIHWASGMTPPFLSAVQDEASPNATFPTDDTIAQMELRVASAARNAADPNVLLSTGLPVSESVDRSGRARGFSPHIGALQSP